MKKKSMKKKSMIIAAAMLLGAAFTANAQVTIGNDKVPENFSVLELVSNNTKGLRLPQLTTVERDAMEATAEFQAEKTGEAMGVQIFNTTTYCVETWNGTEWIGNCMDCDGVLPALNGYYAFCNGATVADLTAMAGGNVQWHTAAKDGTPLAETAALISGSTYYAEQRIANCTNENRIAVNVTVGDCTAAPAGAVTTFTNVMYDFQHQTLEAYSNGGWVTGYQWQMSATTNEGDFQDIAGATSKFYTVPAHYADSYFTGGNLHSMQLYFRCIMTNPAGTYTTSGSDFHILFINTSTAGYGEENGVKYLLLQKGEGGVLKGGTIKLALLSLGQSANWDGNSQTVTGQPPVYTANNDAGDLGDFYQWGRVADGHQKTVWSKNTSHVNQIFPEDGVASSAAVEYSALASDAASAAANYDTNPQSNTTPFHQVLESSAGYGKYISAGGIAVDGYHQWYNPVFDTIPNDFFLWGQITQHITGNRSPAKNGNDPCPQGWKVPSRWDFYDINDGNGTDTPTVTNFTNDKNNDWEWREATNNAMGGTLITNASGEILFLPALGNTFCNYWSSTSMYPTHNNSHTLTVYNSGQVLAGSNNSNKSGKVPVRCIKE